MFVAIPEHCCYDTADDVIESVSDNFLKKLSVNTDVIGVKNGKVKPLKPKQWIDELTTHCKVMGTYREANYTDYLSLRKGVTLIIRHMGPLGSVLLSTCCVNLSEATLADEHTIRFPYGITFLVDSLEINGNNLEGINQFTKAVVPYGVKDMRNTFSNCSGLTDVELPSTLDTIGDRAFSACSSLEHINLKRVTGLEDEVFSQCSNLKSVTYESSRLRMGGYGVFSNCVSLEQMDLKGVLSIGEKAFKGTKLKDVALNANVTIDRNAFSYMPVLESIKILSVLPNKGEALKKQPRKRGVGVTEASFVSLRSLKNVDMSGWHIKELEDTFKDCQNLETVVLPTSVRAIGRECFMDCHSLRLVVLPDGLQYISKKCVGDAPVKFQYKGNLYTPQEFYTQFPSLIWSD